MANIVELREMSGDKLTKMLEDAREDVFNLRFQKASARLEDYSRLKVVRRNIAQLETELRARQLAKETVAAHPEVAPVLKNRKWQATARFSYEDSVWHVTYMDEGGKELASAMVDLNHSHHPIKSYKVAG